MWWERWIPKALLTKSNVVSVDCVFENENTRYFYSHLQIKKNKIDIVAHESTNDPAIALASAKKIKAPIVLSITGKGVITKKIIFSENDSLEIVGLIKQHLPTINEKEFDVQFYKSSDNSGFLCICRKDQVQKLLSEFAGEKNRCVNVFIGPFAILAIKNLTAGYNKFATSNYEIDFVNDSVDSVRPASSFENEVLKIDGLSLSSQNIIPFAGGFSYFTRQMLFESNNSLFKNLCRKHFDGLKLQALVFFFIGILFVASVINSVLFFQKFEENNSLTTELNLYESKNNQITKLLENYQKKKVLFYNHGIF